MLEYKIVEKEQFTIVGKCQKFNNKTSYEEIPKFWQEFMACEDKKVEGMFGLCETICGDEFDYYIADNYTPWEDIPEGYTTKVIPAGTWAIFPCRGNLPKALHDVNTKIWNEWLPENKEYKLAGNYDIEFYPPTDISQTEDYSEIWIPIEKIN